MNLYHIYNDVVMECNDLDCDVDDLLHFDRYIDAIISVREDEYIPHYDYLNCKVKVKKYTCNINNNSGLTAHFENHRKLRELELTRLLGVGVPLRAFVVDDGSQKLQIQEVRDNGVIYVYDYETHRKITLFAPHPHRISNLFQQVGELPPEKLIDKSSVNYELGYNEIYNQ